MLQLYRLTNTDIVSLQEEKAELEKRIHELNEILDSVMFKKCYYKELGQTTKISKPSINTNQRKSK